ncbi:SOS-response transcriptional repressor LexA [Elusimicrobium simillimum]
MEPEVKEGEYVIIRPGQSFREGDIVVARMGEDCTLKRIYIKDNLIYLVPDNPKYTKIKGSIHDIEIMGRVIHIHRPVRRVKRPDLD